MKRLFPLCALSLGLLFPVKLWADAGTEGASFLDIPVGSVPASLGAAYTARATDAYAPVWNPAGLGFLDALKLSGTHLAYIQGIHYEYLGAAVPFHGHSGFGASVQYLGSGDIVEADEQGNILGSFQTTFAAYSLAYGQSLTDHWSLGLTGKAITEKIADASAKAYATDVGTMYKVNDQVMLAAVAANVGSSIKFVHEKDPLPLAYRLGVRVQLLSSVDASAEAIYHKTGVVSGAGGVQWSYGPIALRGGLNSAHVDGLSSLSAISAGVGLHLLGQEFAYAWVPYSNLGAAHYFSMDFRFGPESKTEKVGLVKIEPEESPAVQKTGSTTPMSSDYQLLDQLLSDSEKRALDKNNATAP